jgi:ArsR family transcriptional regulator
MKSFDRDVAARVLQALAHPLRLGILERLAEGERSCKELHEALGCSQSMLSQQLKILEHQGLVRCRKQGTVKICDVRNPDILKLFNCLQNHICNILGK